MRRTVKQRTVVVLVLLGGAAGLGSWFWLERRDMASGTVPDNIRERCAACHATPRPEEYTKSEWSGAVVRMMGHLKNAQVSIPYRELDEIRNFYVRNSSVELEALPLLPPGPENPLKLVARPLAPEIPEQPAVGHVAAYDLNRDGQLDLLLCELKANQVSWAQRTNEGFVEHEIAALPAPAHATPVDFDDDGDLDILVAVLGKFFPPTEELIGSVVLLRNEGNMTFEPETLVENVSRVSDVRPGDLDGDGDLDVAMALFGGYFTGAVGWLEATDGEFVFHELDDRAGAIHAPVVDLDGDGDLDIVAVLSQRTEQILAFINDGAGEFEPVTIFDAETPTFGSSGMRIVDLDQDGDPDILYVNGDAFDVNSWAPALPKPYHGVWWFENHGQLKFERHLIAHYYGAYDALAQDMDNDGDLDVVASSLFNLWVQPGRASLIWLQNDGQQRFTRYSIATTPTHLVSITAGDWDRDGDIDLASGGLHMFPPFDRKGRVTLWFNEPRVEGTAPESPAPSF